MWVKILKYAAQAAVSLGLHKKVLGWVVKKLEKAEDKAIDKLYEITDTLDKAYDVVEPREEE